MNRAVLLLGGNLNNPRENFKKSCTEINKNIGTISQKSSLYESEAWGFESEYLFLNQVIIVNTKLNAFDLLKATQEIERKIGRKEKTQSQIYSSRLIDIDILFFNNDIIETKDLIVPHAKLHLRNFTLLPLKELIPEFIHPVLNKSIIWLTDNSIDNNQCLKLS